MAAETLTPYQRWRAGLEADTVENLMTPEEVKLVDVWMETARDAARSAYAQAARAKGCLCLILARAGEADFSGELVALDLDATPEETVEIHDRRCPVAIADEIEAAGEEDSDGR